MSEKSVAYVSATYSAMIQMAEHFGGKNSSLEALYASFRRGWEAGCEKGPDEADAYQAKFNFMQKSVAHAQYLHEKGLGTLRDLIEKKAQLELAQSELQNRLDSLPKCRSLLFPSLDEIRAITP